MLSHETVKKQDSAARQVAGVTPEAAVASLRLTYKASPNVSQGAVADRLAGALADVARTVRQGGGFVGHIKSYLSFADGGGVAISVVRDQADRKVEKFSTEALGSSFDVAVTAIVYNVGREDLAQKLRVFLSAGFPEPAFVCHALAPKSKESEPKAIMPFRTIAAN